MVLAETIQIVSSGIMFFGIILSLLLWLTTLRSLREVRRQNDNIARSIKTDIIHRITMSHQNIFLAMLNNPTLTADLIEGMNDKEKFSRQMIGTLLINHCAAVHLYGVQQTLEPGDWLGIQNDITDLFSWPVVKERWPQIRNFYSKDFQDFIETVVNQGQRTKVKDSTLEVRISV